MRTVGNIRAGGVTKISGILHSLLLLAVVLILAPLASKIPHAVLAGILVKVGYDIIDLAYLKRAHRGPRFDLTLMVMVLSLTVFVDLITAVVAGVVVAAVAFVKQVADAQTAAAAQNLLRSPRAASGFEHVFPPASCCAERHHPSAPVKHHWAVRRPWHARSGVGHATCLWMLRWGPTGADAWPAHEPVRCHPARFWRFQPRCAL